MKNSLLRNTVQVRLLDKDYEKFLENAGKQYSATLRTLIKKFNASCTTEDSPQPQPPTEDYDHED